MSLRFWVYVSLAVAFNINALPDNTLGSITARCCIAGLAGLLSVMVDARCGKLSWSLKSKSTARTKEPARA